MNTELTEIAVNGMNIGCTSCGEQAEVVYCLTANGTVHEIQEAACAQHRKKDLNAHLGHEGVE